MAKIYNDITETIGNTPLVRLNRTAAQHGAQAEILLKLEFFNPLSSVKDRIGFSMIDDALKSGKINQKTVLIEPTSGNTGIALAFVAAAKGLKLILTMPETMTMERRKLLKVLGARPVLNTKIYDEVIRVKEADSGPVSKQINQLDGIPVGISSGAAAWAALQLAQRPENKGKMIVAIIPSSSERYLSSWLFADVGIESD